MNGPELRAHLGLNPNTKTPQVYNAGLRLLVPGGSEVLDTLTRLHEMQHNRARPDPAIADLIDWMRTARDKMTEAMLKQTLPG